MPRNRSYRRGSQLRLGNNTISPNVQGRKQSSYTTNLSGSKRHQYSRPIATASTIAADEYSIIPLVSFQRTFGTGDDEPDTPALSNNLPTHEVMNGSKIQNYASKITVKHTGSQNAQILDVYEVQLSFYDVLVWNTILPSACPFNFETSTVTPDKAGVVTFKATAVGLVTNQNWLSFKIVQHYMKYRGQLTFGAEDGTPSPAVDLNITRIPAKCRRSNLGMMWALILLYSSDKNASGTTFTADTSQTATFDEIPADNRLPFVY